ncbi:MAG: hypothetical protein K8R69_10110 [Deltaproteobacteria bacterium]|nr:hypothetical protein [Deltaproteobacteria bacterium]
MTPCNNCHGGEGTRPTRSELQWLRGDDLPVAPTMDCPAEAHWPEALRQARPELQGYPWWTRGNFRATQHRMQPSTPTYSFDLESGSVSLDLGLRSFVYNLSNHRTTFNSWSTYTVDVHADPNAGLALNLEVEHNRLSLDNGLIALSGVSIDGPYFFNFSDIPRQGIFDPAGNFCLLPSTLLAYPSEGFSAHPRSHLSVGINILRPDLLNIGGGGGISANLCFPMPGEFREPRISSEAPLPSGYELHDLADRVQSWRANRPQNPVPSSDSVWNHLYLSSGRRLQNVFELLRVGSEAQVNLRDLQDLFIPGLIDLGPSQANLQVRWTAEGELEASLRSLVLAFQEMGYGTAAGTETPGFLLQSARVTGPESESALNLRFDPIARQLRSLRGHLDLEAAFSLLRLGLRNLQIQGHADIARTAEGNFAFSLSNFNFLIPRNTLPTSDPNAIPLSLEGSLRGAEGPHELLGVSIPGGLRGEWNPLRNEVHLEGNLVLRGEIDGPRGHYEARVPLTFFTTLRMGPEGARPVPGSTAMEIHDLEIVHAETRREVLREGEVFLSDDPEREIFRPNPDFHRFRIGTEEFGGPPTSPVSVEIRGIWANHHRVSLRGEIPLALESGPSPSYDFSRLLQDGSEFHVDMEDLQPVLRPPETSPHFNVIGGHLRVQRFPQADGSWLWDIMLGGDAMTLGEGRKGLSLRNPELALEFDRLSPTDEGTRVRIPLLDFRANAQGADSGMLRGPVQLHLNPHQAGLEWS